MEEFISMTCVHVRDTADKKSSHTTDVHLLEKICKHHFVQKQRGAKNRLSQNYLARFSPILDQMNTWHTFHFRRGTNSLLQFEGKEKWNYFSDSSTLLSKQLAKHTAFGTLSTLAITALPF